MCARDKKGEGTMGFKAYYLKKLCRKKEAIRERKKHRKYHVIGSVFDTIDEFMLDGGEECIGSADKGVYPVRNG